MSGNTLPFPGGDFPRPFGVPHVELGRTPTVKEMNLAKRAALAGPESAAEHLRNALQLLRNMLEIDYDPADGSIADVQLGHEGTVVNVLAVRRRVAAAIAAIEGKDHG